MSSQVVRVQGFSKGSLGAIGKEVEREEKDFLENRNQDIDKNRTHLNEFYKHTQNGMYGEWKDICKNLNVTNSENLKKNAIAFEGIVITSDKEYFEKLGYVQGQEPPQKVKEFFDKSYEFVKQEVGFHGTDKNILCASVHYDETTPHLQVYYVPVVDSWKEKVLKKDENGKVMKNEKGSPVQDRDRDGKLLWNEIKNSDQRKLSRDSFWKNKGGNKSYTQMQDRYYEQISKEYGLGRGEKGSTREHTTKQEWEHQKLNKEIVAKRKELTSVEKQTEKLKSELAYSKEGIVHIGLIPTKEKASEIENQNRALKRELQILQSENEKLKSENQKLKEEKQVQEDALKDRGSMQRKSLDALDHQNIYNAYIRAYKPQIERVMKPFEDMIAKAHSVGKEMVMHKREYVYSLEARKTAQNDVKIVQARRSTLEAISCEIGHIESEIEVLQHKIKQLEHEREGYSTLNVIKKRDCDKQIKSLSANIKAKEEVLENKYGMKNRTDQGSVLNEMHKYDCEIQSCTNVINAKSIQVDNLTNEASEHLKAYKITQQSLKAMNEPFRNIVSRYDNEYVPPQEYRLALEPGNTQGLSRNRTQAQEELKMNLADMKELINHQKANEMLSRYDKPKMQHKTHERTH